MAGARREVDLVIRAKDEASKAVDSVAGAFDTLVKAQKNLKQSAAGSDSSLVRLGVALKDLETNLKGLSSAGGLNLSGTAQTLAGLQAAMSGVGDASARFSQSMNAVAYTTDNLRGKLSRAREALRGQAEVLADAESAHRKLVTALGQEETAQAKATATAQSLFQKMQAQEQVVANAANRYLDLSQKMVGVDAPTKKFAQSLETARKSLVSSSAGLDAMRAKYDSIQATIRATTENIARLTAEMSKTNVTANQQKAIYSQIQANVLKLEKATAAAANRQKEYNAVLRQSQAAMKGVRTEMTATAGAQERNAAATTRVASAHERSVKGFRAAMSWGQRLRGEVLSLITAYAGLYGAINLVRSTVDAFTTLEGATSRLNVVFDGDQSKVAQNLDLVRRTADRLGLSFGVLADEYSKLAASAKGTELEGQKVNEIFVRMAEAVRVNKLSIEGMKGSFMAISQIITKGVVNMEELRQQLAERFPGAIQLMANGFGYGAESMDEFFKAVARGDVKATALLGFADELGKRFGPQLAASLSTTMAQIGFFQNELYKMLLTFGDAGLMEGFTKMLESMVKTMKDPAFLSFAGKLSQGFGKLAEGIGWVVENLTTLVRIASVWVGFKLAPLAGALTAKFIALGAATSRLGTIFVATRNTMVASTTTIAAVTAGFRGLRLAIMALLGSTGIGLAIMAISTAIGFWATKTEDATVAMEEHKKVVDKVKNAYEDAKGKGDEWRKSLGEADVVLAETSVQKFKDQLEELKNAARSEGAINPFTDIFSGNNKLLGDLSRVSNAFEQGRISAKQFEEVVASLKTADPKINEKYIVPLIQIAREAKNVEGKIEEAKAAIRLMGGAATEADLKLLGLGDQMEDAGVKAANMAKRFEAALTTIREMIPAMAEQVQIEEKLAKIKKAEEELRATGTVTPEIEGMLAAARVAAQTTKAENSAAKKSADEAKKRAEAAKEFHEQIVADVDQMRFELSIQEQTTSEQELQKTLRQYELKAKELGTKLSKEELSSIRLAVIALNEKKAAQEAAEKAETNVNLLLQRRQQLEDQLKMIRAEGGSFGQITALKTEMTGVNDQLIIAIQKTMEMWQAVGGESADAAISKLQTMSLEAERFGKTAQVGYVDWEKVRDLFTGGFANAIDSFAESIANGENAFKSLRDAFLSFASDFLRQIAQMIAQAAAFNMLKSAFGGTSFGTMLGLGHKGGVVGSRWIGSGNPSRRVSPIVFAGAPRFHEGGLPGLRPGEVPAILKKNEEVLNENDPRNALNGGITGGQQPAVSNTKIVNAIDSPSFLSAALSSSVGEKVLLNFIRANSSAVKSAMGG